MSADDYRAALTAAIEEYEALGEQRRDIETRLARLSQTINTLSKLLGLTPTVPLGLTDAVRLVLRGSGVPMTPVEVRDQLHAIGFNLSKYANDLAAVHTILKRLNASGEVRVVARGAGKTQYVVNPSTTIAALGADIVRFMRDNAIERQAMSATDEPRTRPPPPKGRRQRGATR